MSSAVTRGMDSSERMSGIALAALAQDLKVIRVGSIYARWEDLKKVVMDWSVISKFTYIVPRKEAGRVMYVCSEETCPWHINAILNPQLAVEVTDIHRDHTYQTRSLGGRPRQVANRQE